jgi:hypothetical protein
MKQYNTKKWLIKSKYNQKLCINKSYQNVAQEKFIKIYLK